jgi:cytochrome c556
MKRVVIFLICAFQLSQVAAFAHEGKEHTQDQNDEAQMHKLHKMMPMYAQVQARITEALEKGDATAVETETGKLTATIPDLKKAKPHKNLKQLKTFRNIAVGFGKDLKETVTLVKNGDFDKAKDVFKKAEAKCAECHAIFRD